MFNTFFNLLGDGEAVSFKVARTGNQLTVLVQPSFKGTGNDKESAAIQNLRSAIAMPLYVTTTPEALDRDFPACLGQFAQRVETGKNALSAALDRQKEGIKEATAAVATESGPVSGQSKPQVSKSDQEKPSPDTGDGMKTEAGCGFDVNSKSLF